MPALEVAAPSEPPPNKPVEKEWNGLILVIEVTKNNSRVLSSGGSMYMMADYGYVKGTPSMEEGEGLDVFMNPEDGSSGTVYIVGMLDDSGVMEEEKCFLDFPDAEAARKCFTGHYDSDRFGYIYSMEVADFRNMALARVNEATLKSLDAGDPEDEEGDDAFEIQDQAPSNLTVEKSIKPTLLELGQGMSSHQLQKCIEARRALRGK